MPDSYVPPTKLATEKQIEKRARFSRGTIIAGFAALSCLTSIQLSFVFKDRVGPLPRSISSLDIAFGNHPADPRATHNAIWSAYLLLGGSIGGVSLFGYGMWLRRRDMERANAADKNHRNIP